MANREINTENHAVNGVLIIKKLKADILIIVLVGVFIGYLSPFGMDNISFLHSVSFWVVTCLCGYFIYRPAVYYGDKLLASRFSNHTSRVAISALFASICMSFVVPIVSWLFFNVAVNYQQQFLQVFPKAIVIGGVLTFISLLKDYFQRQKSELIAQKQANEQHVKNSEQANQLHIEKFMAHLPVEKRGELYCLEMSDHYVKVYTSKGHHLLLMRFKDALALLEKYDGLQTHRSWWVARSAIDSTKKIGRKIFLVLENEIEVPVSRTYAENVRAANIRSRLPSAFAFYMHIF